MSPMAQQMYTHVKYPRTTIFEVRLGADITRVSHSRILQDIMVKFTTRKYRQMKKQAAPRAWNVPVPPLSIVAIAARYPQTENMVGQYMQVQIWPGYWYILACFSNHLKITWKIRVKKLAAEIIIHLKTIACGWWQAVPVTVVCGNGSSCLSLTDMYQQYAGANRMSDRQIQRTGLNFREPISEGVEGFGVGVVCMEVFIYFECIIAN